MELILIVKYQGNAEVSENSRFTVELTGEKAGHIKLEFNRWKP